MEGPRRFLNVVGNSKAIAVSAHFAGWTHILLDIDPTGSPDVVCDARDMKTLPPGAYDAVYCSHNLEHFFEHDVPKVLSGFLHVLNEDGFAEIRVPNLQQLMQVVVKNNLDVDAKLYDSPAGPVRVRDVIYGYAPQIAKSGVDFYAHKTGFSPASLVRALQAAGFSAFVPLKPRTLEIAIAAFRKPPTADVLAILEPSM